MLVVRCISVGGSQKIRFEVSIVCLKTLEMIEVRVQSTVD